VLEINDLEFYYDKNKKIYRYDLIAKKCEVVSIMGKSGSGKSTLLDILAGFLKPICGEALYNKKNFLNLEPQNRPLSILFQNYNLFEYLNVEQNIAVGIDKSFKITKEKYYKISKILKEIGLENYQKRAISSLSGGEQQRVALARVLVMNRPVLLLDEPFGGLDKEMKTEMLKLVKDITIEKKLITLMVTHDEYDSDLIANKHYHMQESNMINRLIMVK
jgi:thiamine transport system ATP-binding protein